MDKTAVVTTRIDSALVERLDSLGRDLDRSRAWLVALAIERLVAEESALIDAIRAGEADFAAGRTLSQTDVEQRFGIDRSKRQAA